MISSFLNSLATSIIESTPDFISYTPAPVAIFPSSLYDHAGTVPLGNTVSLCPRNIRSISSLSLFLATSTGFFPSF